MHHPQLKSNEVDSANKYSFNIPRASLSSSSGSSSKSSSRLKELSSNPMDRKGKMQGKMKRGSRSGVEIVEISIAGESESEGVYINSSIDEGKLNRDFNKMSRKASHHPLYIVHNTGMSNAAFHSIQSSSSSSSASNQSNYVS